MIALITLLPGVLLDYVFQQTPPTCFYGVAATKNTILKKHSWIFRMSAFAICAFLIVSCLTFSILHSIAFGKKQLSDWLGGLCIAIIADVLLLPVFKAIISATWYKIQHTRLFITCASKSCFYKIMYAEPQIYTHKVGNEYFSQHKYELKCDKYIYKNQN